MIGEVRIENYKSIQKLKLELGRVTVLIGENGCGKSNILEAIALASAAADDKLDNEFLASRGIRVTEPQLMRSAFEIENLDKDISIELRSNKGQPFSCILQNDNAPYSQWLSKNFLGNSETSVKNAVMLLLQKHGGIDKFTSVLEEKTELSEQEWLSFKKDAESFIPILDLNKFIIYSPENLALRTFEKEGQIQPLGINGEGLFKLINFLSFDKNQDKLNQIKKKLQLIAWFKDFEVPQNLSAIQTSIQITDRYLDTDLSYFDQRSSNEGFLFLLFYFTLFISDITPKFFAIDNIDASLNPRLCRRLIEELVELAKKHDKQVIFTTHNPAVLDGLDLDDDEQRLLVISRNQLGYTKARRILKPKPLEGQEPVKLSEAFLRGYIGGLPKNF
ncbi:AAA family ATPase [Tychonema sp. LEGE 07199]|nr:AAA family ATPase [Tychonema sp. LEGE 07199]MBE9134120.1 AAA family ATPase [Tychonema sp. LEGE 07196]